MTLLNKDEQKQVAAAIAAVERETDAELVTVLARRADDYSYIPRLWAAVLALVLPGVVNYFGNWLSAHNLLLVQWACFIVLSLLFRSPPLLTRMIPRSVRQWRASGLARRQFLEQNLHHTVGETGMLIFVSEAEHYVEILVDRGISSRIPDATWQEIIDAFTDHVKAGRTLQGFLECIEACGRHLKQHVPATHGRNELSDHLVILD